MALDGLNLDVASGAIHAVVGENGAGKSTLMKVLAGVVKPDAGAILFDGTRISMIPLPPRADAASVWSTRSLAVPAALGPGQSLCQSRTPASGLISTRAMEEMSREFWMARSQCERQRAGRPA